MIRKKSPMHTIAHEIFPELPRMAGAWQRPFKTIALLACVAVSISACKTTSTVDADGSRRQPAASYAHLEPEETARELFNKAQALIRQDRKQEAFATVDELDLRFGKDPRRSVRDIVVRALSLKAQSATSPTESLDIQTEIGRRYKEDINPALRTQIVTTMFNQAATLAKEGKISAAIPIYKEIEETYGDGDGKDKSWGAWAISYQGDLQRQMRNPKAAIAAYERLDQRFGQETDPATRPIIADALLKKGETLTGVADDLLKKGEMQAGQETVRAAIATYEEADRRYGGDRDAGLRQRAVRALLAKGSLLERYGAGEEPNSEATAVNNRPVADTAAAIAVYDDIVRRFGRDKDPGIHSFVGHTLHKKSETLRLTGNDQGTVAVYDEIVERFGNDDAQISRRLVATALFRKGQTLGKHDGTSATAAFDELIRRFANDADPTVRKILRQAVTARQKLITGGHDANSMGDTPMHDN